MDSFFTKDKQFYKTLFSLFIVIALQNLVAYSVNMLDNIMLGSYSQSALSGAATVNQIFFLVNQTALAIGNAFVAIASQYWGKRQTEPIRHYVGVAMSFSLIVAFVILVLCSMIPERILGLFTTAPEIIEQGCAYLGLLKWTFVLFMVSNLLICALRSVETVKISFAISVVSDHQWHHQLHPDLWTFRIPGNGCPGGGSGDADLPYSGTVDRGLVSGEEGREAAVV